MDDYINSTVAQGIERVWRGPHAWVDGGNQNAGQAAGSDPFIRSSGRPFDSFRRCYLNGPLASGEREAGTRERTTIRPVPVHPSAEPSVDAWGDVREAGNCSEQTTTDVIQFRSRTSVTR